MTGGEFEDLFCGSFERVFTDAFDTSRIFVDAVSGVATESVFEAFNRRFPDIKFVNAPFLTVAFERPPAKLKRYQFERYLHAAAGVRIDSYRWQVVVD